ncbi:hypothetical protein ACTMU2_37115 [Cupriavidus basilensis]
MVALLELDRESDATSPHHTRRRGGCWAMRGVCSGLMAEAVERVPPDLKSQGEIPHLGVPEDFAAQPPSAAVLAGVCRHLAEATSPGGDQRGSIPNSGSASRAR